MKWGKKPILRHILLVATGNTCQRILHLELHLSLLYETGVVFLDMKLICHETTLTSYMASPDVVSK